MIIILLLFIRCIWREDNWINALKRYVIASDSVAIAHQQVNCVVRDCHIVPHTPPLLTPRNDKLIFL
jgi:hypothetical protein